MGKFSLALAIQSCLARSTLHAEPVAITKQTVTYMTAKLPKETAETLKGTLLTDNAPRSTKNEHSTFPTALLQ